MAVLQQHNHTHTLRTLAVAVWPLRKSTTNTVTLSIVFNTPFERFLDENIGCLLCISAGLEKEPDFAVAHHIPKTVGRFVKVTSQGQVY
jgi:hypothetical protein